LLLLGSLPAVAQEPAVERAAVLPIQDRSGDAEMVDLVAAIVEDEMRQVFAMTPSGELRDAFRRLRIRNPDETPPDELREAVADLGVDWLLSVTLHSVSRGLTPRITLSGWAARVDGTALGWAGFHSASGLDSRGAFDRGVIDDPVVLAERVAAGLVREFHDVVSGRQAEHRRPRAIRSGYLSRPMTVEMLGTVAVLPYQSVTDEDALRRAETMTALARAALFRAGVRVSHPGLVGSVLRRRGLYLRAELDPLSRAAVGARTGAGYLWTGTVERWAPSTGLEPNPIVAFSSRLIEIESGRIAWIDGVERSGVQQAGLFGKGEIYDPGVLAQVLMESLIEGILNKQRER
jgi:hypothetical protein